MLQFPIAAWLIVASLVGLDAKHVPLSRVASVQAHAMQAPDNEEPVEFITEVLAEHDSHSAQGEMPKNLNLRFSLQDEDVVLDLTQNPNVPAHAPVFLGRKDGIHKLTASEEQAVGVYHDVNNKASVMVTSHEGETGRLEHMYSGLFRRGERDFLFRPAVSEHARRKRDVTNDVTDTTYYIYHAPRHQPTYENDTVDRVDLEAFLGEGSNSQFMFMDTNSGFQTYGIEILLLLDYGMYKRWRDVSYSMNPSSTEGDIINNMKYYFTHVANGIDMRYKSISHSRMSFYARLSAFYIATTPDASPFTEKFLRYEPGENLGFTHAYDALDDLYVWIDDHKSELPHHDQATLISGYQLYTGFYNDGGIRTINGLAFIEAVCTRLSVAVCADWNQYQSIQTSAHEIGHNLGAVHDGTGNSCASRDQYIMAVSPGNLDEHNYDNVFQFSVCSIDDIAAHMDRLRQADKNCLMNEAKWYDEVRVNEALEKPLGKFFDLNQTCEYSFGKGSYYCGGHVNDGNFCEKLECYNPTIRECARNVELRAKDYTTCGNNKWCVGGRCVYDPSAPPAKEYCMTGDLKGVIPSSHGETCQVIRDESQFGCYNDWMKDHCCETCDLILDTQRPECPYGDRADYCKMYERQDCYAEGVQYECCGICEKFKVDVPGCEYGDKAGWCSTSQPRECYSSTVCCEHCEKIKDSSRPGCEWGDRVSWCMEGTNNYKCYDEDIQDQCCKTCDERKTTIPGCEYGNKIPDCHRITDEQCDEPHYKENCCHTCGSHVDGPDNTVCPTGDQASWCPTVFPGSCYGDSTERTCCATCPKHKKNLPGCEYGNRASWCATFDPARCTESSVKETCCELCRYA